MSSRLPFHGPGSRDGHGGHYNNHNNGYEGVVTVEYSNDDSDDGNNDYDDDNGGDNRDDNQTDNGGSGHGENSGNEGGEGQALLAQDHGHQVDARWAAAQDYVAARISQRVESLRQELEQYQDQGRQDQINPEALAEAEVEAAAHVLHLAESQLRELKERETRRTALFNHNLWQHGCVIRMHQYYVATGDAVAAAEALDLKASIRAHLDEHMGILLELADEIQEQRAEVQHASVDLSAAIYRLRERRRRL